MQNYVRIRRNYTSYQNSIPIAFSNDYLKIACLDFLKPLLVVMCSRIEQIGKKLLPSSYVILLHIYFAQL